MGSRGQNATVWGQRGQNRTEHEKFLRAETRQLLDLCAPAGQEVDRNGRMGPKKGKNIAPTIGKQFLSSLLEYWEKSSEKGAMGEGIKEILTRLSAIEASQKTQSPGGATPNTSQTPITPGTYASVAASAAGRQTSPKHPQGPEAPATRTTEVRVAIRDKTTAAHLRAQPKPSQYITDTANNAVAVLEPYQQLHNNGAQTTAFRGATLLKSGDVVLLARDSMTAELLKKHRQWEGCFGPGGKVQAPVYGVVVFNIPKALDLSKQAEAISILRQYNPTLGNAEIEQMFWLSKPKPAKWDNSMVVELRDPAVANACLAERLVWEGAPKKTEKYLRGCQLSQCFKCHNYGHTAKVCPGVERCGHCSSVDHTTRNHHLEAAQPKLQRCPLCKKAHPAWSEKCQYRKEAILKVKENKKAVLTNPWFQEPFSPTPTQAGTQNNSSLGSSSSKSGVSLTPQSNPSTVQSTPPNRIAQPDFSFTPEELDFPALRTRTPEPVGRAKEEDCLGFTPVKGKGKERSNKRVRRQPMQVTTDTQVIAGADGTPFVVCTHRKFRSPVGPTGATVGGSKGITASMWANGENLFAALPTGRPETVEIQESSATAVENPDTDMESGSAAESAEVSEISSSSTSTNNTGSGSGSKGEVSRAGRVRVPTQKAKQASC